MEVLLYSTPSTSVYTSNTRFFPSPQSSPWHVHDFISAGKKAFEAYQGERLPKGHICQLHTKPAIVGQLISLDHPGVRASPPCELLTALGFV